MCIYLCMKNYNTLKYKYVHIYLYILTFIYKNLTTQYIYVLPRTQKCFQYNQ